MRVFYLSLSMYFISNIDTACQLTTVDKVQIIDCKKQNDFRSVCIFWRIVYGFQKEKTRIYKITQDKSLIL